MMLKRMFDNELIHPDSDNDIANLEDKLIILIEEQTEAKAKCDIIRLELDNTNNRCVQLNRWIKNNQLELDNMIIKQCELTKELDALEKPNV